MQFKLYVRALITNGQGNVLLAQKQPDQKIAAGKWLLPGGTVEFGETPIDALKRELKEETNFSVKDQKLLGTETMIVGGVHWLGLYYRAFGDTESVKNLEPDKHAKIEWCPRDFAKANLSPEAGSLIEL